MQAGAAKVQEEVEETVEQKFHLLEATNMAIEQWRARRRVL